MSSPVDLLSRETDLKSNNLGSEENISNIDSTISSINLNIREVGRPYDMLGLPSDMAVRLFYNPETMRFTKLGSEMYEKWRKICSEISEEREETNTIEREETNTIKPGKGFIKI